MKGQYLAIESVLTLGIGLVIATGTITLFTDYRDGALETGKDEQAVIAGSKIINAINTLKTVDEGEKTVDLRERIGNDEYRIEMDEELVIRSQGDDYSFKLNNEKYSYNGFTEGGPVKLFKSGNEIKLRPQT